ncbi:MAG: pyridine nucleotide-disulfide oxidoreductase, partial [Chloroflexota bacterium]
ACTEALAYYPVQAEKTLECYEQVCADSGEQRVQASLTPEEREMLAEMLAHARLIRVERQRADAAGEAPNFVPLLKSWGGVTLCYRRRLRDSPAYRINHEEVRSFLEEGVRVLECVEPTEAIPDTWGQLEALRLTVVNERDSDGGQEPGEEIVIPARSVLVAAGTSPNLIYEREHAGTFRLDSRGRFFQGHRLQDGELVPAAGTLDDPGFFTSYSHDGRYVTYYGDNHPAYCGSVVKAMASAKHGYREIVRLFEMETAELDPSAHAGRWQRWEALGARLDETLLPRVERVDRLTPTIVELVVHAPNQARHFQPGQFYRLQNYETTARLVHGKRLQMEGLALTGAWVDKEAGTLGLIALELGASSRLCSSLRPGERVVLMGPTGAPTEIGTGEHVLLAGGGLGNAVLFSLAGEMRKRGNAVLYFAAYKSRADIFHQAAIEAACEQVIWSVDGGPLPAVSRPLDRTFRGNVVEAMLAYDRGELGERVFPLAAVHRMIVIGSDRMMAAVAEARRGVLSGHLHPEHIGIASINSPMQCMMKEVCGQCLQKHVDPATGEEAFVFSCFNQDQALASVDWPSLSGRLRQNSLPEKLNSAWLDACLQKG